MPISYIEFSERFDKLSPLPTYLFVGEERFFIDEGVKIVRERFLEKGCKDFNYDLYSAQDIQASRVVEIAQTLPFMAGRRVVIVKDIDEWKATDREVITAYIDSPSPMTCLILTASRLDRRERFSMTLERKGMVVLCQPLYKQNLAGWIRRRIQQSGKDIDLHALDLLIEMVGKDMMTLNQDIEKLILYCGDRVKITMKDVVEVSSAMRSVSTFEVVDAMMEGRLKESLIFLKRAIDEGEPPVRIFYFIVREFRAMLKARMLIDTGKDLDEAIQAAGVPQFKVKEFSRPLQRFSLKDLQKIFMRLVETDGMLKGGALRPEIALEGLLLHIHQVFFKKVH